MTVLASIQQVLRRVLPAVLLTLAACGPRAPIALAPLPDRPWTVLPGDEVRVRVYREPELSGQWIVNGRGEALFPGLGRVLVAGLTADSLTDLVTARYATRITDAIVDVGIIRSMPVLGEVRVPGVYYAEPMMSIQQLVAKSGGIRSTSLKSPVIMLQKGRDGVRYSVAADQRLDRLAIEEGDAIIVLDPSFLERWAPWVELTNRFGSAILVIVSVLLLAKK